jgi:hypothetical protein
MPSEYDFLLPYSRRLRRLRAIGMGVGAFLAGAVCMAAIIALPLRPHGGGESGGTVAAAHDEQKPAARAVTAAKPEEKPQVGASPAPDQRETVGLVSPTARPADAPPSTPAPPVTTAAKAADTPAAPASAQTSTSRGKPAKQKTALPAREPAAAMAAASTAEDATATPISAEPAAPDNKPKAAARHKSRSTHASRRQQQRRYARSSDEPSSSRSAFADDDRTRYGGTSTFWSERDYSTRWRDRDYSDPASAYDQRPNRRVIIIRRPSWFGDND